MIVKPPRFLDEPWEARIWRVALGVSGVILIALGGSVLYLVLTDTRVHLHRHARPNTFGPLAMLALGVRLTYQAWTGNSKWLTAMRVRNLEIEDRRRGVPRRVELTEEQQIAKLQRELGTTAD